MARTTATLVATIIEVDTSIDLTPFIDTANALVTEWCDPNVIAAEYVPIYTEARLEMIERWLAAHFYAVRDQQAILEKAGTVSATYGGQTGQGLSFTRYGQQAMLLDTNGGLTYLDKRTLSGKTKPAIGFMYLGRRRHHGYH